MDLRYAARRILIALAAGAIVTTLLVGLFCPVVIPKRLILFGTYDSVRFVPAWRIKDRPLHEFWLGTELFAGFLVFASVWFVYPQFDPPPHRPNRDDTWVA